jgi:outer membrane receptor protein involved in Fe transport
MFANQIKILFFICFVAVLSVSPVIAQNAAGISGTVTDSNGSAIGGATVKAIDNASNRETTAVTNENGKFTMTDLRPGTYRISANSQGFAQSAETIVIEQGVTATQNFSLSPGSIRDVVTVTAGKGSDRLAVETPQTVTVTTADQIEQRLPRSTFETLERAPNLTVVETNPARERPRLRGLASTRLLVVIDGEKLNNSRFDPGASGPPIAVVDPSQLEAVEVLAGSGSSLYGSDSIGGTINLITKRPVRPENGTNFGIRLEGNYISNGAIRRGNVTVNLSNKFAAFRGSYNTNRNANYKTGNGGFTVQQNLDIGAFYRQFPTNATGTTFQSASGYPIFALPAKSEILNGQGHGYGRQFDIWFFPSEKHTFRAKYLGVDDGNNGNGFSGPPYETQERYTDFRTFDKWGIRYEGLDLNKYLPRVSANFFHQKLSFPQNQYTYVNLNSTYGGSYVSTTGAFTGNTSIFSSNIPAANGLAAVTGASYVDNQNSIATDGIDLQAAIAPFRGLLVTVGGGRTKDNSRDYFFTSPFTGYGTSRVFTGPFTIGASAPVSNYTDNNLYSQVEFDRVKWFRVSAGIRRDNWVTAGLPGNGFPLSTEFAALNAAIPGLTANPQALTSLVAALPNLVALAGGTGSVGSNRNSTTYNVGIVGRLPYGINPYFRYANSYREPGITERYLIRNFSPGSFFASLVVGNPNLLPEKGKNYDVGVKIQRKTFNFSLGYFQNTITDLLAFSPAQNYCVTANPPSLPGSAGSIGFGCSATPPFQAVVSINARINSAKNIIKGWESTGEVSVPLGSFGSINPFYTLGALHGTNKSPVQQAVTALNLLYNKSTTPIKLTGSLDDFPLANITPFRIIAGAQYLDLKGRIFAEYNWRHQNRVTRADPLGFIGTALINYGTFASLNSIDKHSIKGGYIWRNDRYKFTMTAGIDNIANKFYFEQFNTAPAPGRSFVFGFTTEVFNFFKK